MEKDLTLLFQGPPSLQAPPWSLVNEGLGLTGLQEPRLNKQLSYQLLDLIVADLWPHLAKSQPS